jgi:hypothetical protein
MEKPTLRQGKVCFSDGKSWILLITVYRKYSICRKGQRARKTFSHSSMN